MQFKHMNKPQARYKFCFAALKNGDTTINLKNAFKDEAKEVGNIRSFDRRKVYVPTRRGLA